MITAQATYVNVSSSAPCPASAWPAWTDSDRWVALDAEVATPDPLDEIYDLGFRLGLTALLRDHDRFHLADGSSYEDHLAFFRGFHAARSSVVERLQREQPDAWHDYLDELEAEAMIDSMADRAEFPAEEACGRV